MTLPVDGAVCWRASLLPMLFVAMRIVSFACREMRVSGEDEGSPRLHGPMTPFSEL
jgi:hypothetical protein